MKQRPAVTRRDLRACGHVIAVGRSGTWSCNRCHQSATQAARRTWISLGPCVPPSRGLPFFGQEVHVGSRLLHRSHSLRWFPAAACWCCEVCGATARHKARKLFLPCGRSSSGLRTLKNRLLRGETIAAHEKARSAPLAAASAAQEPNRASVFSLPSSRWLALRMRVRDKHPKRSGDSPSSFSAGVRRRLKGKQQAPRWCTIPEGELSLPSS